MRGSEMPMGYDKNWNEDQAHFDNLRENELLFDEEPMTFITERDPRLAENIRTTLFYILQSDQSDIFDAIKEEKKWKKEGVFDDNIKRWNEHNPSSFTRGIIASIEDLEKAIAEGKITKDAPWLGKLKQKMDTVNILMQVKV